MFRHPKYYTELRKRNKSDQAISDEASTEATSVRPGPGLKVSSSKHQATRSKHQAPSLSKNNLQASSPSLQASSSKPQAASS